MKRLITASIVRQERHAGRKRLEYNLPMCIVTPEARTVAEQLGLELVDVSSGICCCSQSTSTPKQGAANAADQILATIRAAIMAQLPAGSVPENVVDQMVQKAIGEQAIAQEEGSCVASTNKSGIKLVDGKTVKMGILEGAGRESRVGVVDVVSDADGSSMGAGFMAWENCFFPWTLTYDEVDYIIEGELHIRCNGETTVGKAGDVIFIPKNTPIAFGTPTKVKFLFVTHPANWADL